MVTLRNVIRNRATNDGMDSIGIAIGLVVFLMVLALVFLYVIPLLRTNWNPSV